MINRTGRSLPVGMGKGPSEMHASGSEALNSLAVSWRDGDEITIGTMFLAQLDQLYLIGTAHFLSGHPAHGRWDTYPTAFILWNGLKQPTSVEVINRSTGQLLFRHFPLEGVGAPLADMIAIPVLDSLFTKTRVHDLRRPRSVRVGDDVSIHGYPKPADSSKWPTPGPIVAVSQVESIITAGMKLARSTIEAGHSGSPVLDGDGALVGMMVGNDETGSRIAYDAGTLAEAVAASI